MEHTLYLLFDLRCLQAIQRTVISLYAVGLECRMLSRICTLRRWNVESNGSQTFSSERQQFDGSWCNKI